MGKILHKADLSKIYYVSKMIEFMSVIQMSAKEDYTYYFENSFPIEKLKSVLNRLDEEYHISDTPKMRSRRNIEYNMAITVGHFFYPGGDTVYFVLMSKPSLSGIKHNNFFDKLKYFDLTKKEQRLEINHYQLSRVNQEKTIIVEDKLQKENINEVWTYGLSDKYIQEKMSELHSFLKTRNWSGIEYIFKDISSVLPFSQVRKDYMDLRRKMFKVINRFVHNTGVAAHEIWKNIEYRPPETLGYFRGIRVNKFAMSDINSESALKKIHKKT